MRRIPGSVDLHLCRFTLELKYLVALNRTPQTLSPELASVREGGAAKRVLADLVECTGNSSISDHILIKQLARHPPDCRQSVLIAEYLRLRRNAVDAWYALARVHLEDDMRADLLNTLGTFARVFEVGVKVTRAPALVKIFLNMMADLLRDVERGSPEHGLAAKKMEAVAAAARRQGLFTAEDEAFLRVLNDAYPRRAAPNIPILLAK